MSRVVGAGGGGLTSLAGRSRQRSPTRDVQPLAGSLRRSMGSSASAPALLPAASAAAATTTVAFGAARVHSPPRVQPRKQADLPSPVLQPPALFSVFVDTHYVPPSIMPTAAPSSGLEWNSSQHQPSPHAAPKAHAKHVSKSERLRTLGQSQSAATLPPLSPAAAAGSATTPASPASASAMGHTTRAASALATATPSPKTNRASGGSGMVSPNRASGLDSTSSRAASAGSRSPFTTSSVRPSARLRAARSQLVLSPLGGSGSAAPPVVAPSSLEQGSTYISPTYTFTSGRQADGSYERWFDLQAYESYKRTGVKVPPRQRPPNPPLLPRPAHSDEESKEEHGAMIEISDEQLTAAMHQQLEQEQHLQAMVDEIRANQQTDDEPSHQMQYAPRTGPDAVGKPPARRRPQAQEAEDEDSPHDSERDEEIDNWDDDDEEEDEDEADERRDRIKEEGEDRFDEAAYDDLTLSALRSAATDRSVKDLDAVRARARMERRRARRKKEEEARAAALNGGLGLGLGGLGGGPGSANFLSIPGAPLIAMSGLPVAGTSSSAGLGGGGGGGYTSRQMSRRVSTVGVTFSPATFDTYDEDVKQGMESVAEIYPHNQAQHSSVSHVQRLTAVEQQKREEKERLKALQVKRRARRRQAAEDQVREIFGDAWWMVQPDRIPDEIGLSSKSAKALAHMRRLQAKAKRAFTSATLTIHHNHATNYRVHPAIKPLNFFRILPDRPQPVIEVPSAKASAAGATAGGHTLPNGAMTSTGSGGTTYKNDGSLSALGAGPPSPLPQAGGSQMFRSAAREVAQALAFARSGAPTAGTAMGGSPEKMPPSTARGGDKTTRPLLQHQLSSSTLMPPQQTGRTPGRGMLGVAVDHEQSASGSLLRPGAAGHLQPPQGSPGRSFTPSPTLSDRRGSTGNNSNPSLSDRANAAAAAAERATLQPQTGKFVPHPHTGRIIPMPLPPTKPHTLNPGGTTVDLNKDSDEESSESEELSDEDGPLQSDTPPLLPLPAPSLLPPAAAALLAPGSKPEPPPPAPVPLSSPSWPLGPPQARREEELETLVAAATRSYALTTWLHKHGKHGLGGGGAAGVAMDPALAHRYHDAFKTLDASASGEITAETIAAALRRTHNLHLPAEELEVLLCKLKLAGDYSLAGTNAAAAAKARRARAFAGVSDAMLAASHFPGSKHKEQIQQQAFVSALATTSEWEALLDVWRARKAHTAAAAAAAATAAANVSTTTATAAFPSVSTSPERRSPSPTHHRAVSIAPSHTRRSSMASTGSQTGGAGHHRSNSPATLLPFLLWIPAFQRLQLIEAAMELSRGTGGAPGVLSETQLHPPAHAPAHERERASVLRAREAAIQARFERLLRKIHMPSGSTLTELWQATRSQVRKELEDQAAGRFHPNDSNDVSVSESDDSDDSWFDDAAEGAGGAEGGSDSARILASPKAFYEGMLEGTAVAATKVVDLTANTEASAGGNGVLSSPTSPLNRTLSSGSLLSLSAGVSKHGSLVTSGSRRNLHRQGSVIQSGGSSQSSTHRGGGDTSRIQRALHGAGFMGGPMLPSSTPFGPTTINNLAPPVPLVGVMSKMKQRGLEAENVAIAQAEKRLAAEHARNAAEEHAAQIQAQREREALAQDAADRAALALEEEDEAEPAVDGLDLSADPVDESELDELASIKILRSPLMAGQSRRALEWTSTTLPRRLDPLSGGRPGTAGRNTPRAPEVPSPLQRPKGVLSSPKTSPKSPAAGAAFSLESPVFQVHVHSPKSSTAAASANSASVVDASTTPSNKLYRRGSGGDLDALHATLAANAAAAATAAATVATESPFEVLLQFTWIGAGAAVSLPPSNPEAGWKRLPLPAVRTAARDLIVCSFSFRSLARRGEGASNSPSSGARNALVARSRPGRNDGVLAPLSRLPSSSRAMQTPPLRAYAGIGSGPRRTLSALPEIDGDSVIGGSGFLDSAPVDEVPPRSSNSSPQRRALKTGEHLLSFVVNPMVQLYKNDRSLIDVSQLGMQQSRGHAAILEAADERLVYVTPQFHEQLEE